MKSATRCASLLLLILAVIRPATAGPLEEYLQRPDPSYRWSRVHEEGGLLADYYFLRLVSQTWLDASLVDRPLWTHDIRVAQPRALLCGDSAKSGRTAIIIISGGHNKPGEPPNIKVPSGAGLIAHGFCRPVIELRQVPNEPLTFADETASRKEDGLIAYSLDQYLRGSSGDWPVQLAMVRSVVQAMTAMQEFSRQRDDIPDIDDFVLIGASKRGWTAWLTAAVDARVRAIVPVSIDMPGVAQQFAHHFASYGDYAPALADYKAFNIACRMGDVRGHDLVKIIDPLAYRERLTLPKLIVNSSGDQFFVTDSWRFYYDQLLGDKVMRYTVNSDHKHGGKENRATLFMQARNWIDDVLAGREPPQLSWQRDAHDVLTVRSNQRPRGVRLWTADNPAARDFRLETLGAVWTSRALEPDRDGAYRVKLEAPAQGWRAALVEATYGGVLPYYQQIYTTGVYVLPQTLPFAANQCPRLIEEQAAAQAAAAPGAETGKPLKASSMSIEPEAATPEPPK